MEFFLTWMTFRFEFLPWMTFQTYLKITPRPRLGYSKLWSSVIVHLHGLSYNLLISPFFTHSITMSVAPLFEIIRVINCVWGKFHFKEICFDSNLKGNM